MKRRLKKAGRLGAALLAGALAAGAAKPAEAAPQGYFFFSYSYPYPAFRPFFSFPYYFPYYNYFFRPSPLLCGLQYISPHVVTRIVAVPHHGTHEQAYGSRGAAPRAAAKRTGRWNPPVPDAGLAEHVAELEKRVEALEAAERAEHGERGRSAPWEVEAPRADALPPPSYEAAAPSPAPLRYEHVSRYSGEICDMQLDDVAIELYSDFFLFVRQLSGSAADYAPYDLGGNQIGIRNERGELKAVFDVARYSQRGRRVTGPEYVAHLLNAAGNATGLIDAELFSRARENFAVSFRPYSCGQNAR